MATEGAPVNGTASGANGASTAIDADKAAFIAGVVGDSAPKPDSTPPKPAPADDDSDLDEDEDLETAAKDADEDIDEEDEKPDDDSDLDEEDDEDKDADKDTAKRIDKVKRTDKRLRERRESDFKAREASIQKTIDEWQPRIEKAEAFEKRFARGVNPYDVADVLADLGLKEEDFEAASQTLFARTKKFADKPETRETVARMKELRELRDEAKENKKWRDERDARDKQAAEEAAAERRTAAFLESTTKATTEKTPLAAALIEKNPARAHAQIAEIAGRYIDEHGVMPTPKQVIIALEKSRRQDLRDLGVDPKSITSVAAAKKATDAPADKAKPAAKKTDKPAAKSDGKTSSLKDDFIHKRFD